MQAKQWTNEQLDAINISGCDLLVAAAAGSGKTAVLVERIIRMITRENEPIDIDRLLIITFTNAAAAEMRQRIADALAFEIEKRPDSLRLQRQLALLPRASIMTIHSFCLDTIRNNFHKLDIDPGFRIADETEAALLKLQVLDELFEECYSNPDICPSKFFDLVKFFGGRRDDSRLKEIVLDVFHFVQSFPWPEKWLDEALEKYKASENLDFLSTSWCKYILDIAYMKICQAKDLLYEALDISNMNVGLEEYAANIETEIQSVGEVMLQIRNIQQSAKNDVQIHPISWDALCKAVNAIEFKRVNSRRKNSKNSEAADETSKESVKSLRDEAKELVKDLKNQIFCMNSEIIARQIESVLPLIESLSKLVILFINKYQSKKREKSLADFNDLEHFCIQLLYDVVPSSTAVELQERYEEVLVDEYQDCNLVQEVIINAISRRSKGKNNVFMVGDIKQSIYRFRHARPELFLHKYRTYSQHEGNKRLVKLYKNFRSRRQVLDFVNMIFSRIMSEKVGEMDYTNDEKLNAGASYPDFTKNLEQSDAFVEICLVDSGANEIISNSGTNIPDGENGIAPENVNEFSDGEETHQEGNPDVQDSISLIQDLTAVQREARLTGQKILRLLDTYVWDKDIEREDGSKGDYRQARFNDMVILMRATSQWAEVFVDELSSMGIPVYADTATGYFKAPEIHTMLSLLQIIDNPRQDIPLIAVMRSPVGGFSLDELAKIRLKSLSMPFHECVNLYSREDEKTRNFLFKLRKWRNESTYLSVSEIIWHLFHETGYLAFVGALPGGEQRQANLKLLYEKARKFENTSMSGLFNFVNYIRQIKISSRDMGDAKILGENANVVRIMSIHKSKGLEFPIVFLVGCGKQFNMTDTRQDFLLDQDLGIACDFADIEKMYTMPSIFKRAISSKIYLETLAEEMRVLYVALTRAKEKLIITGTFSSKRCNSEWMHLFVERILLFVQSKGLYGQDFYVLTGGAESKKIDAHLVSKAKSFLDWIVMSLVFGEDMKAADAEKTLEFLNKPDAVSDEGTRNVLIKFNITTSGIQDGQNEKTENEEHGSILGRIKEEGMVDCEQICQGSLYGKISRRLEWKYPYEYASKIPAKLSVTELKRLINLDFENTDSKIWLGSATPLLSKPSFMDVSKKITASEKGTIIHFVMQHLDLSNVSSGESIIKQIDAMVKNDMLTHEQTTIINVKQIKAFFESELGRRMLNSTEIYREVPFHIQVDCSDKAIEAAFPDICCEGEKVLIQGIIDCCFKEEDEFVLIDYKTDVVQEFEDDQELISYFQNKYRFQLDFYKRALEYDGKKVKKRYLYLFDAGRFIEMQQD